MTTAELINQDSGNVEYYSPSNITGAARRVMGGIDLDPASCEIANRTIQATRIFTEADDGFVQDWFGRVWLNHPFGREEHVCETDCKRKTCLKRGLKQMLASVEASGAADQLRQLEDAIEDGFVPPALHCTKYKPGNKQWIDKLVREYQTGRVTEACCICFAATSEAWFKPLMRRPQCFLSPRTNYYAPDGSIVQGVSKGSVVTYFGPNVGLFAEVFEPLGEVLVPYHHAYGRIAA